MFIKRGHWTLLLGLACSGVQAQVIGYRGPVPLLADPFGGQVAAAFDAIDSALPRHKAGQVRIPPAAGGKRSFVAPSIPNFEESGDQP